MRKAGGVVFVFLACLLSAGGCAAKPAPARPIGTQPLPLAVGRERLREMVIDSFGKRVMGRRESLRDVARIATQTGPIIAAAARQPQVEGTVRLMADDDNTTAAAARKRWIALQEADLLLESGGDPDALSPSEAAGVAQWLASTGSGNGLRVNVAESKRLTRKIDDLRRRIAWLEYLQRPDANRDAPGAPSVPRADAAARLPALRGELQALRAKRRSIDARYDPRKAVFAQSRYLARLYRRYRSIDWVYQAYHGGEGGAQRTLRKYLGAAWPGSMEPAIRRGRRGRPLRFEHLFFAVTPRSHPEAFAYLYGRSDDHRHYWWKLLVSQEAIALYRRDPAAFRRRWEAYLPGRPADAVWYPDAPAGAMPDLPALQSAHAQGRLVPVGARPDLAFRGATLDPTNARWYAALQPASKGALLLVTAAYRRAGGSVRLSTSDLALTQAYVDQAEPRLRPLPREPRWPPDPEALTRPGGGPPVGFDYHTAGIVFDVLTPRDPKQRKLLDYALGYLNNRRIVYWFSPRDRGERRYHVVPNPRYAAALARIAQTGQVPALPGL